MNKKRQSQTQKVQKSFTKKTIKSKVPSDLGQGLENLRDQYQIIRDDIIKLKVDLQKGYDLAKGTVEKKGIWGQLIKGR
jgi:hypothetical protein